MKIIDDARGTLIIAEKTREEKIYTDSKYSIITEFDGNIILKEGEEEKFRYDLDKTPFDVERVFFLLNVPIGMPRGDHAHYECSQFLVCMKGKVTFKISDGQEWTENILNEGEEYLLSPLTWIGEILFHDAVLGVICSHRFSEADYIRGFSDFKKIF